ncbi:hypothetical protein [Agrococcus carbonis]|uniref:Uncharacterized protein n=1 Tax=Agrococcus carbonis TaxID=684552 RepID=A0A1H1Q432_9MICO|nr:hypothetical protein [Agrococcus carbonis]SDS18185.1 hypothetical protein SAMN04489719_1729 [Agrococcus carbonis]
MTVPNPAPQLPPQPFAQNPDFAAPGAQQAAAGQPYAAAQPTRPYVPPVYDAGPPKPPRPKLTKEAARRARLAGGVGGGIAWLGIGIMQLCATLLLLPVLVGSLVFGLGFAFRQDGTSATGGAWNSMLEWLGSPWGILLGIGVPIGLLVALLGLWVSTRILRHPDVRRPVGITWAGFGIAVAAAVLLSGAGSVTLPFFGGFPLGPGFDIDRFGPGPGPVDDAELERWFATDGADMLERIADPGTLLGFAGPWLAIGQLLALVIPIVVSIFTWWWMAHAMRPALVDGPLEPAPERTAEPPAA